MSKKRSSRVAIQPPDRESSPGQQDPAAYFLSLELQNVRCFGDQPQSLDLSDGNGRPAHWTILLGDNGTGKTTVLQSLSAFESISPAPRPLSVNGVWMSGHLPRGVSWAVSGHERDFIRGEGGALTILKVRIVRRTDLDGSVGGSESGDYRLELNPLSHSATYAQQPPGSSTGLLCYAYGAGRRLRSSSLNEPEPDDATRSLFHDDAELRNAEEWLLRIDYSASKPSEIQERQRERLDHVKALLIGILPEVDDTRFTAPTDAHPNPEVEFRTPYGWVPLRQLGYGYRTLIAWMVDFASRMVERYPDSPDPLAGPAVVLVDEIDLHLHPTWQRKLIGYLTERFPNTQFIATAHSPLIVQAAAGANANIALLRREGDHVVIENDVEAIRNWRVDQVLTSDLFGLESARPPEVSGLLERRKQLLTKPKLTKADRKALAEIEAQLGPLPTGETAEQAKVMAQIDETLRLLKQRQGLEP
jgi:AAA domain, putative AbiEii toxin, Type IV TA system/AAA domain